MRMHRIAESLAPVSAAVDTLRREGLQTVLADVLDEYEDLLPTVDPDLRPVTIPLYVLLNELHLLLDERALAYPTGDDTWQILDVPELEAVRKNHSLATVEGTRHGSSTHVQIMRDVYSYDGFVGVEEGDVVVDTGAYVGGFTFFAADAASEVVAIEPNAVVSDVLWSNTVGLRNVTVLANAAWNQPDELEINTSAYEFQNSAIDPDDHETGDSFRVRADTIPNLVRERGHERIDFLKIEAEGVEPEILSGALEDGMEIQKVAVDASPERDGDDAVDEIEDILTSYGYACRTKERSRWWWGEDIVFGRKESEAA